MAINYQGGNDAVITGAFTPLMQTIQRNYLFEQEQKNQQSKQAAELQKQIQKDLSQVNANGLRQADLPAFTQQYSGVKDNYYKFLNAKSPEERSSYAMQINEGLSNLNTLVGTSKEYGKIYSNSLSGLGSLVGKGKVDEARNRLLELGSKPSSELTREAFDTSDLLFTYNPDKANTSISKGIESAFKNSTNVTTETILGDITNLGGGRRERRVVDRTILNEGVPLDVVSKLYQTNTDVKGLVDDVMTEQGVDLNTALAQVASLHEGEFVKDTARNVNPDKSSNTTVVNVNMPSEAVSENYYKTTLGNYTSNETTTYKEDVPLIGTRDVYTSNGRKYTVSFQDATFRGQALLRLPVDNQGNPLPTDTQGNPVNENQVAGYREFVAGTLPREENTDIYNLLDPQIQSIFREQALLPMSQIQWIGQSNTRSRDLRGVQNQTQNTPVQNRNTQNNSVPSQSTAKPKFN